MSCGLGAVILVLMLVKQDVQNTHVEADLLRDDLARLAREESALRTGLDAVATADAGEAERVAVASQALALSGAALEAAKRAVAAKRAELQSLRQSIETTETVKPPDVIETPRSGEETYIIGLRVEGPRIVLLVDASASMTDEVLIDIIRRKNASDAERMAGPKWQRTRRVVEWLLARAPAASQIAVIAYADAATPLGGTGWQSAGDGAAMRGVLDRLGRIVPQGPTNLQAGLQAAAALRPSDIYLVTDGLPTAGGSGYKSLNPFSNCSALWGGSATISGECRARLFLHTIKTAAPRDATVNVVLLPIEGDPAAAALYWSWTAANRGVTISPAASWP